MVLEQHLHLIIDFQDPLLDLALLDRVDSIFWTQIGLFKLPVAIVLQIGLLENPPAPLSSFFGRIPATANAFQPLIKLIDVLVRTEEVLIGEGLVELHNVAKVIVSRLG